VLTVIEIVPESSLLIVLGCRLGMVIGLDFSFVMGCVGLEQRKWTNGQLWMQRRRILITCD